MVENLELVYDGSVDFHGGSLSLSRKSDCSVSSVGNGGERLQKDGIEKMTGDGLPDKSVTKRRSITYPQFTEMGVM